MNNRRTTVIGSFRASSLLHWIFLAQFALLLSLASPPPLHAQSEDLSEAEEEALEKAREHMKYDELEKAIGALQNAYEVNPDNPYTTFQLGRLYVMQGFPKKALPMLEKTYELDPDYTEETPALDEFYAEALHYDYQFDKAVTYYQRYLDAQADDDLRSRMDVKMRIRQCKTGKRLLKDSVNVLIENAGPNINTEYPEYVPVISADEKVMIFTSRRQENIGDVYFDGFKYEDIYISKRKGGEWGPAENIGRPVNTKYHDAVASLSPDGEKLFVYRDKKRAIYVSERKGHQWAEPEELPKQISQRSSWEPHAALSSDGNTLYFVSDREGGFGGLDLYKATKTSEGEWGEPVNLGRTINTPFDERGPFMHPDGRTLFFASQGHLSMGKLDIFKAELQEDSTWSDPKNVGYPINSTGDDAYFVVAADGKHAYFASHREDSHGDKDIYRVTYRAKEMEEVAIKEEKESKDVQMSAVPMPTYSLLLLKGVVTDAETGDPLKADIVVIDNETGKEVSRVSSNSSSGKYLVTLPAGSDYGISVTKPSFLFHSENFVVEKKMGYREVEKDVQLQPLKTGNKVVLRNIFFDFDKATLRSESEAELESLVEIMVNNPKMNVRIGGHTDSRGSDSYNQDLSRRRAKSVVDYLIKRGIDEDRLDWKGYGESQPIATNDTHDGRQKNRRTEFEILSF